MQATPSACFYYSTLTRKSQLHGVSHSLFVHVFKFKHCTWTFCDQGLVTLLTLIHQFSYSTFQDFLQQTSVSHLEMQSRNQQWFGQQKLCYWEKVWGSVLARLAEEHFLQFTDHQIKGYYKILFKMTCSLFATLCTCSYGNWAWKNWTFTV